MPESHNGDVAGLSNLITVKTPDGDREVDIYTEEGFRIVSNLWTRSGWQRKISYEVTWLGIPIIQLPEDILMIQELIWKVRPEVIIECGVAHGGALIFYASLLELLGRGRVIGIDVDLRKYNRLAIESHPLSKRVILVEGDSGNPGLVENIRGLIHPEELVMVMLDSNHSQEHVGRELDAWAPLVTPGGYIVVFDEVMRRVADAPNALPDWATDNPAEAVAGFLRRHPEFEPDPRYERLGVSYCWGGFLRRLDSTG